MSLMKSEGRGESGIVIYANPYILFNFEYIMVSFIE